jgi:hypothetical protein
MGGPMLKINEDGTVSRGILAYHGSPADFDKFDSKFINTGEGAQVYGHGLYFADREGIAKSYRDNLAKDPRDELNDFIRGLHPYVGTDTNPGYSLTYEEVKHGLANGAMSPALRHADDDMVRDILTAIRGRNVSDGTVTPEGLAAFQRLDKRLPKPEGKLYQVALNHDPEHFLDWDMPLSEQSDHVRKILLGKGVPDKSHVTGEMAYQHLVGDEIASGRVKPQASSAGHPGYAIVSNNLREAGIPGIKYLDQGSRGGGAVRYEVVSRPEAGGRYSYDLIDHKGGTENVIGNYPTREAADAARAKFPEPRETRNYVIFDDNTIDILKRYAKNKAGDTANPGLYDPPVKPSRPFEADYPAGAQADATGRLTQDIEGRPLNPGARIVGRSRLGGDDQAIPRTLPAYDALAKELVRGGAEVVEPQLLPKKGGKAVHGVTDILPGGVPTRMRLNANLAPEDLLNVYGHELGHVHDEVAGQINTKGLTGELKTVYNDLNNPSLAQERKSNPNVDPRVRPMLNGWTPETNGYRGAEIDREYIAEALRAYMHDPNYVKTVAPKTAEAIRAAVNRNPRLSRSIQFNTLGPLGALVAGGAYHFQTRPVDHDPFQ